MADDSEAHDELRGAPGSSNPPPGFGSPCSSASKEWSNQRMSGSSALSQGDGVSRTGLNPRSFEAGPRQESQDNMDPETRKVTIEDFESSWSLLVLRLFHAWSFLLATVVIAGYGINSFLNMFLQFIDSLARGRRVLEAQDWLKVLMLVTRALLFVLIFAGLVQRGIWLFLDSLQIDMFYAYRRTLCGEGVGPGTFRRHPISVRVTSKTLVKELHHALSHHCALEKDMIFGQEVVPKGSQLLAVGAMEGKSDRDDVLSIPLDSDLVFRVEMRPIAFEGVNPFRKFCAGWDMACQWLIFLSMDLLPILAACSTLGLASLLSLGFLNVLATVAIEVAVVHIIIYFVWSTAMDYYYKLEGLCLMFRGVGLRARTISQERELRRYASATAMQEVLLWEDVEVALGEVVRKRGGRGLRSRGDSLNACVCLRTFLLKRIGHIFLLVCAALSLLCAVAFSFWWRLRNWMIACAVSSLVFTCVLIRSRYGQFTPQKRLAPEFLRLVRAATSPSRSTGLWAQWFRANCAVEPAGSFGKALGTLLFCAIACVFWYFEGAWDCFAGAVVLGLWSLIMMVVCFAYPVHLWKFILMQSTGFAIIAMWSAARAEGFEGASFTILLILFSQLGMWRQVKTHGHAISVSFFVLVVTAIAGVTFAASAFNNGGVFGNPPLEFCPPAAKGQANGSCREFEFPLHGVGQGYEFCGLSWPMGSNGTTPEAKKLPGTVSDRCEDTSLALVDFGQMATIAGYLPNMTRVSMAMSVYLPGWRPVYWQVYNISTGRQTTFIHISRGTTDVIAVRGTSSAVEVLQDMNFWMPVGFLQLARKLGPSVYSMRSLLEALTQGDTKHRESAFQDLVHYMDRTLKNDLVGHTVYITGHSLGGGLATAVAGIFSIPAVTFSAPGLEATAAILRPRPSRQSLARQAVNVVPHSDIVPMVDEQAGTVLKVLCPLGNPGTCHRLTVTMCELLASCGDGGGRPVPRGYVRSCSLCRAAGQNLTGFCSN